MHHGVENHRSGDCRGGHFVQPLHHRPLLPDKAIDLIDEAAARIKIEIDSKPESLDKLDRRLIQLKIEREAVKRRPTTLRSNVCS